MHTLRLWSLPSIKEWRVYCLRYPLVEWAIYGMWAFVGFTALQSLWGGSRCAGRAATFGLLPTQPTPGMNSAHRWVFGACSFLG